MVAPILDCNGQGEEFAWPPDRYAWRGVVAVAVATGATTMSIDVDIAVDTSFGVHVLGDVSLRLVVMSMLTVGLIL